MDYLNLNGKTALVLGIANRWSIAYAIAELLQEHGVRLAVTYQNERIGAEVRKLTSDWSNVLYLPCELTEDTQIDTVFADIKAKFGQLNTSSTVLPLPIALSYKASSARYRAVGFTPPWISVRIL